MIFAGIDAGSRAVKIVLINEENQIIGTGLADQGVKQNELALNLLNKTVEKIEKTSNDISYIVATGYGRDGLDFADTTITEITCHARGVSQLHPEARTIIDIGGQDSKLIRLEEGRVRDFVMNDRCAAGTGRFLEIVANRLDVETQDLGGLTSQADNPATISSMCVVFAETEIIGLLASGVSPENIAAGVAHAIATRISAMAGRNIADPIIFTGGVARIPGMDRILASVLDHSVHIADMPQMTGALGAALLARSKHVA